MIVTPRIVARLAAIGLLAVLLQLSFFSRVELFHVSPDVLPALVACIGLLGGFGHLLLIRAMEHASPSTLAPFFYSQLIWSTLLAYLAFGDFPKPVTLFGMLVVVADTLARSAFAPLQLPVGVLTALIGVPVFLWFLMRR